MLLKTTYLITTLAVAVSSWAQQSPSPTTPPPQTQAQTTPCTTANPTTGTAQNNKPRSAFADRWKKKINDESAKLGAKAGVPMPTTDDLGKLESAKPAPCPSKAASPSLTAAPQPATLKLPPDTTVTLHCNPLTPSPQGTSRQTTLTLPDPKDFALPQASDFLVDSVVPDTAARTPCYLIKVDPKTGKSFVQQ